jgi:hypothetical protein
MSTIVKRDAGPFTYDIFIDTIDVNLGQPLLQKVSESSTIS